MYIVHFFLHGAFIAFSYSLWSSETNISSFSWGQITHKINKLSFGDEFPGVVNPLDGLVKQIKIYLIFFIVNKSNSALFPLPIPLCFGWKSSVEWTQPTTSGMYQYFIKVSTAYDYSLMEIYICSRFASNI